MSEYVFCPYCTTRLESKKVDDQIVQSCPKCGFIFWNNPKPVVSILLHRNGKILMIQRALEPLKGQWCLPGGFIQYSETPLEAIERETKEEIGIVPTVEKVIGAYRIDNDPRGIHIDIIYEGKINGNPKLSSEHGAIDFFTPENLPEKIAYKHREAIQDWLSRK